MKKFISKPVKTGLTIGEENMLDSLVNGLKKIKKTILLPKAIIPKIDLTKTLPDDIPIQIQEPVCVDGNISLLETLFIVKLIKAYNPGNIFEIGTFNGRTTLNMAANCSSQGNVYTLDLPRENTASTKLPTVRDDKKYIDKALFELKYRGKDAETKIVQLYGDSATFDFSPFYNNTDFIFVDGSHSYEYALNDSLQALKLLRNGRGIILWHDYDTPWWKGVTKALNELYMKSGEFKGLRHIEGTSMVCLINR